MTQLTVTEDFTKHLVATKLDILEFIMRRNFISPYELVEKFHYSENSVRTTLNRLKKAGLIINMTKDYWELTVDGYKKLRYYRKR